MQVFMQPLEKLSEYGELKDRLPKHKGILQLSGCVESQKAHMIYLSLIHISEPTRRS